MRQLTEKKKWSKLKSESERDPLSHNLLTSKENVINKTM